MNETLWKHREKKWTPVDKQAAMITRKALPFFLPPEPEITPKFLPTFSDILAAQAEDRRQKIELLERENRQHEIDCKLKNQIAREIQKQNRTYKVPVAFRNAQNLAALRAGKPKPGIKELRKLHAALKT